MSTRNTARLLLAVLFAGLSFGCAGHFGPGPGYSYFNAPDHRDAWSPKIGHWQTRARSLSPWSPNGAPDSVLALAEPTIIPFAMPEAGGAQAPQASAGVGLISERAANPRPAVSLFREGRLPSSSSASRSLESQDLRDKYARFRAEQRRQVVRDFAQWIQLQSQSHYVSDGPVDQWATLEETLRKGGEDCDGLELLVYHGLRDLGFRETEVFRSVVYRSSDLRHHMVTLWFEDPEDPWVIDPTGVITGTMTRMSELSGWVPLKIFTETSEYSVRRRERSPSFAGLLAANP